MTVHQNISLTELREQSQFRLLLMPFVKNIRMLLLRGRQTTANFLRIR